MVVLTILFTVLATLVGVFVLEVAAAARPAPRVPPAERARLARRLAATRGERRTAARRRATLALAA
jgi:hypothetical protein